MLGLGSLSSLGVGTESVYGTPVAPTFYLPFKSENFQAPRESVPSGALSGVRVVDNVALGIKALTGGFVLENDANAVGQGIMYWNGISNGGYAYANTNTLSHFITAAPTATTTGSDGTLTAGDYRYKVGSILNRTVDNLKVIMPCSAEIATPITVAGAVHVALAFTNPTSLTLPFGFTYYGTAIYRTMAAGATNTEKYLTTVVGTGASYNDTGSVNNGATAASAISPVTVSLHRHRFIAAPPTSGEDAVPSFTTLINKNNGLAEQYSGCRMNEFSLSAGGGNDPIEASFTALGRNVVTVAETTPSVGFMEPILGWKAAGFVNNATSCELMESFQLQCTNNAAAVPGFCATPYNRDVASGIRGVSGSFNRTYEDHEFFDRVQIGEEFALKFNCYGQPIVSTGAYIDLGGGVIAQPFPFFMEIELFRCRSNQAGGNVGGPDRIVETVNFQAFKDATQGTEMRITLYNTISQYV